MARLRILTTWPNKVRLDSNSTTSDWFPNNVQEISGQHHLRPLRDSRVPSINLLKEEDWISIHREVPAADVLSAPSPTTPGLLYLCLGTASHSTAWSLNCILCTQIPVSMAALQLQKHEIPVVQMARPTLRSSLSATSAPGECPKPQSPARSPCRHRPLLVSSWLVAMGALQPSIEHPVERRDTSWTTIKMHQGLELPVP